MALNIWKRATALWMGTILAVGGIGGTAHGTGVQQPVDGLLVQKKPLLHSCYIALPFVKIPLAALQGSRQLSGDNSWNPSNRALTQVAPAAPNRAASQSSPVRPFHSKSAYSSGRKFQTPPQVASQGTPGVTLLGMNIMAGGQMVHPSAMDTGLVPFPVAGVEAWYNLSIYVPETGLTELFVLGIPAVSPSVDAPLFVGFHQNGVSHGDIIANTSFWEECKARGWYFLTPLARSSFGSGDRGFSSQESQVNARAALQWVTDRYPIDDSRIYGVGFSSGGGLGGVLAARYIDSQKPMFAAYLDHTGTVDMVDSYGILDPTGQSLFQFLYGGTPQAQPFEYRRSSLIELDINKVWTVGGKHMGTNLGYLPIHVVYNTNDPLIDLVQQSQQFFDYLQAQGHFDLTITPVNFVPSAGSAHTWDTLDEVTTCDWLETKQLEMPSAGNLLIDRDARFLYFEVIQDFAGSFSKLVYNATPAANGLALGQFQNIASVEFSPAELGLQTAPGQLLNLDIESLDGGDVIRMTGIQTAPTIVLRDGIGASAWTYSPSEQLLEITENNTGHHFWGVQF